MAAGGLGAAVIGALITLAGCVVYIVFMALPSKPEGARFDDGAAATPMPQVLTAHHTARLYPRISPLRTRPHPASTSRPRLTASRPCQPPTMASRLHPHLITVRCRPRSTANRRPRPHSTARFRRCLKTPATNPQHLLSTRLPPATMPRNPGKASNRYRELPLKKFPATNDEALLNASRASSFSALYYRHCIQPTTPTASRQWTAKAYTIHPD